MCGHHHRFLWTASSPLLLVPTNNGQSWNVISLVVASLSSLFCHCLPSLDYAHERLGCARLLAKHYGPYLSSVSASSSSAFWSCRWFIDTVAAAVVVVYGGIIIRHRLLLWPSPLAPVLFASFSPLWIAWCKISQSVSSANSLSLSQLWLQLKPSRVKESHRRRRRLSVSPVSAAEAMNRRIDGRYCCVLLAEHNARVSTIRPTLTMDNKSIKARWIWCGVAPESRARRRRRLRRQLGCTRPCLKKS